MAIGVGIEIGPSAVRGMVLEHAGPSIKVLGAQDLPCETANAEALTRTLTQLRLHLRIAVPVILGVPSTSVILAAISPLVVSPKRAILAVQFELQQQVPFELADAAWHYHWLSNGVGSGLRAPGFGQKRNVSGPQPRAPSQQRFSTAIVAAMRRSFLDERIACCHRAGLLVREVGTSPLATLNAWDASRSAGLAPTTLLQMTGEQMAEWIVRGPASLQVIPVTSPSPEAFWQELAASWEALRGQGTEPPVPIWLVGSEDVMPRVQGALRGKPGLQVERFDLGKVVAAGATRLDRPERFAPALGLALQGLGLARVPLNLLAGFQRDAHLRKVRAVTLIISGVCALAALGFGTRGMIEARTRRARALESLEQQERLYETLRPEIRSLLQRQVRMQERNLRLERLVKDGPLLTQLLAQVAEVLPDDVWLTTVECSQTGLVDGTLEGRSKSFQSVTQFLDRLKTTVGMTTVKPLSTSVITDPDTKKELIAFAVQIQRPLVPPSNDEKSHDAAMTRTR